MSKKIVLLLVATGILAACQPQQPAPTAQAPVVAPEPVYQGKYGAN